MIIFSHTLTVIIIGEVILKTRINTADLLKNNCSVYDFKSKIMLQLQYQLSEIELIAKKIINYSSSKIFLFYGEMGAGKTTLIKSMSNVLGVNDLANSPTFAIVNEYKTSNNQPLYHFDLYRLNSVDEAYNIGLEEYFYNNTYCFVEWPEKALSMLPDDVCEIHIESVDNNSRKITINP